jgi:pyruvate/2-oxoglutarate dehydrogenase complex dihydrolipoamide acyltransferase (E2) component
MMRHGIAVPRTADGAREVTIVAWLKEAGSSVAEGEDVAEATTEKITLYVTAPADGTMVDVTVPVGSKARVGDVIGVMGSS